MIRQVPNRFNPASLVKSQAVSSERFRVNVAIGDFKRLAQLVGDYRLSSGPDSDNDSVNAADNSGKVSVGKLAGEAKPGGEVKPNGESAGNPVDNGLLDSGLADSGFEAVFALSRFADSSFIFDKNEQVAKSGASLPGGNNGGGGSDERAAKTPIIVAEGMLEAVIGLQCQRCLGNYNHRIETNFKFAFAVNEVTAELLPETMDPVLLDDEGNISVVDMFEDELLLRLPTHAVHDDESQCDFTSVPYREHVATEKQLAQLAEDSKPENPFASLKGMNFDADKSDGDQ